MDNNSLDHLINKFNIQEELRCSFNQLPVFCESIFYQWCKYIGHDTYETLENTVNKAMSEHNSEKVNLVGHSLGSMEAISYTLNNPKKVENCITIGSPYNGSKFAPAGLILFSLGLSPGSILQLHPSSNYLKNLRAKLKNNLKILEKNNIKIINIWSPIDQFLAAYNSPLKDTLDTTSPIIEDHKLCKGHCQIFYCDYTMDIIRETAKQSSSPTVLIHGFTLTKNFFNGFIDTLDDNTKEKVYTFSYDFTKLMKV